MPSVRAAHAIVVNNAMPSSIVLEPLVGFMTHLPGKPKNQLLRIARGPERLNVAD